MSVGPAVERDGLDPRLTTIVEFVQYDPLTGEIVGGGQMAYAFLLSFKLQGQCVALGRKEQALTHYVDLKGEAPTVRPRSGWANPIRLDGLTLLNLPVPCRIEISNPLDHAPTVYPCTEPAMTLVFDHPDTWTVRVLSGPYRPAVFTITTEETDHG